MIRYAVIGAGWIAQEAFLPGVPATGNSRVQALVSGHPRARELADFHAIPEVLGYADYDALVASDRIDAVYIALPNSMHADYAIRALKAGKHVLVEKPLATTLEDSRAMIAAAEAAGRFLMTAYRLHNEPGTLAALQAIRDGKIGQPVHFSSAFGFQSAIGNHRLQASHWGGPLQDIGVYCLNAARHVFAAEPLAVQAMAHSPDDPRFAEIDAHIAVTLRFPQGLAQFFCSFGTEAVEYYRVLGTHGELTVDPAFRFEPAMSLRLRQGDRVTVTDFPAVDHFAGQLAYFSDCIATGQPPEADGAEGLADMAALLAIEEAIRTGATVPLTLPPRPRHPDATMERRFAPTTHRLLL
ncbi:Gfo/Idh/MocA family oxidoreductase [Rhodobacter sp. KR11]|uniref:Gfo/Idh/MocA family protein n=1 Tax=Rhodobacter sp. KR11 TaxID=2974588 RepID=UPI0022237A8A|nr:Gfo/Idh/MocA family oxidoreductase [Rhodobacter sp. KR11]MCW1919772.1 Gfo/Idh/MocA family oxidoreductase [Rhodobacter sp. KR11]